MVVATTTTTNTRYINAPTLAQHAAVAVFNDDVDSKLKKLVDDYAQSRAVVLDTLKCVIGNSYSASSDHHLDYHYQQRDTNDNYHACRSMGLGSGGNGMVAPADGAFYVYVDLGDGMRAGADSIAMAEALLEEAG